jgi:hypothetical protein
LWAKSNNGGAVVTREELLSALDEPWGYDPYHLIKRASQVIHACDRRIAELEAAVHTLARYHSDFPFGARVRKRSGPEWVGKVCGYYSSTFTPEGLVIECTAEGARGQVHVEPAKRMEKIDE